MQNRFLYQLLCIKRSFSSHFLRRFYSGGSGRELFAELEKRVPQLIVLDIMLPDEDGVSILRRLRADKRYAAIPVIMATAKGSEFDKVKGLDSGADDYIAKPIVKHGVMFHKGTVRVNSTLGQGTEFILKFPKQMPY